MYGDMKDHAIVLDNNRSMVSQNTFTLNRLGWLEVSVEEDEDCCLLLVFVKPQGLVSKIFWL
jgi:hypothetical protein